jgi:hypothetical protein
MSLGADARELTASYRLPTTGVVLVAALSPDYLWLRREGRGALRVEHDAGRWEAVAGRARVWLEAPGALVDDHLFGEPAHASLVAVRLDTRDITVRLGAMANVQAASGLTVT